MANARHARASIYAIYVARDVPPKCYLLLHYFLYVSYYLEGVEQALAEGSSCSFDGIHLLRDV